MVDEEVYYAHDDFGAVGGRGGSRGGRRPYSNRENRRGHRGRGIRSPRFTGSNSRGRETAGENRPALQRAFSVDNLRRERGSEGDGNFRRTMGRGDFRGRGIGRDHSYDPSVKGRDTRDRGWIGGRGRRGEGRSGRGGSQRNTDRRAHPKTFPIHDIAKIEDIDSVTMRLNSQIKEFEFFMSSDFMSPDDTTKMLKILSRVLQNDLHRQTVFDILNIVCTSRFLDTHLVALIQRLPSFVDYGSGSDGVMETVGFISQLLNQICLRMPSYASKGILLLSLLNSFPSVLSMIRKRSPDLVEGLKQLQSQCQKELDGLQHSSAMKKTHVRRGPNEDSEVPPEDFFKLPIFPSTQDMDWNEKIFLRANKEEGAYRDASHYLDVQFRLLREDYMRPLRKGIRVIREYLERGESLKKIPDIRVYQNAQIIGLVCKERLEHRMQFEITPQLKRVQWQSSKRFMYGSLLCLSRDGFENIFFAVVTNRDSKELEKGIIQISVQTGLEDMLDISAKDTFMVVETTAYFEAYKHVLEGLREMRDSLPMSRYLVTCNPAIKPPQYLLSPKRLGRMDLTELLKKESTHNASSVMVIKQDRWPPLEETTLNASQMQAMQTALSKELAIIQGPPGTGKTYVGLKVAHTLLRNQEAWGDPKLGIRPMLVVCYTNHALDQFLEGILSFCPDGIVRVGSRCKNPSLEEFNLKNLRKTIRQNKKLSLSVHNGIRDSLNNLQATRNEINDISSRLEASSKGIVRVDILEPYMLPGQYDSLMNHGHIKTPKSFNRKFLMLEWLSKGVITQASQEGDNDHFPELKAELTAKILQGVRTQSDHNVDPKSVHSLALIERAKFYRFWLAKVKGTMEKDVGDCISKGKDPTEILHYQEMAMHEILPDFVLRKVVDPKLFSAIVDPIRNRLRSQSKCYVRAWLGVSDATPLDWLSRILSEETTAHEYTFSSKEVIVIPRLERFKLYRFWVSRLVTRQKDRKKRNNFRQFVLNSAHSQIFPDNVLKHVADPHLLEAIQQDMKIRQELQSKHLIRSWLGLQDFCQNVSDLGRILDQMDEEEEEEEEEVKELPNVEEAAEVIQKERMLDLDDDDDLFNFGQTKSREDLDKAMRELGVQSTSDTVAAVDLDDGFSFPTYNLRKQKKKLRNMLTAKPMTEEQAKCVISLWSGQLKEEDRVCLYLYWLRKYQDSLRKTIKEYATVYNKEACKLQELRLQEDKDILQTATVIGMTTTGAAKYRSVLSGVACPVIILEEAAEVLEAHVVTTLHEKCQHLILIGDHQQLRPSPTVYELSLHYKLDLSLFERLVKNGLHHSTLSVQHRMQPAVARLVRHVYPTLMDHETTLNRPRIRGVKQDVFLFHHEVTETRNDETSSKSNEHEAELCVRLCRFLLQQGYPPDTITILTAYSGQIFALKKIMTLDLHFYSGVRATVVDNYQGEENDIIILSLVRSNQEGSVGFLGIDNRVCVAISRARNGFYAFGNFKILAESSDLWKKICKTAKAHDQLGDTLLLRCENHPEKEVKIKKAKDFDEMPEGGCKLPCDTRLDCGHCCEMSCHGYDRDHVKYICRKPCERIACKKGHVCTKQCYQDCKPCLFLVEKTLPICKHTVKMPCNTNPHTWTCQDKCKGILPCGHQCSGRCGNCLKNKTHNKCQVEVERKWPCGHLVKSSCDISAEEQPCNKPCAATLSCGHTCQGTCGKCWGGRVHVICKEKCGLPSPICGHLCPLPCETVCLPCQIKPCTMMVCKHSKCSEPCGAVCQPCKELCPWKICPHKTCEALCHQPCAPCDQPCPKTLKCFADKPPHLCSGLCGEKCFCIICDPKNYVPMEIEGIMTLEESQKMDEKIQLIKLPGCGHIFNILVLDVFIKTKADKLPAGERVCCPEPTCKKFIMETDCWRYHAVFRERHARFQKIKEDMVKSTEISKIRIQSLRCSQNMLADKTVKGKSFISETVVNINTAFALTNQIKLASVFEAALITFEVFLPSSLRLAKIKADIPILEKLVFTPVHNMTSQRLKELTLEVKRFAYLILLAVAEKCMPGSVLQKKIDYCFSSLSKDAGLTAWVEADELLRRVEEKSVGSLYTRYTKDIQVCILDAPPEMDLCDIKIPAHTPKDAALHCSTFPPVQMLDSDDEETYVVPAQMLDSDDEEAYFVPELLTSDEEYLYAGPVQMLDSDEEIES